MTFLVKSLAQRKIGVFLCRKLKIVQYYLFVFSAENELHEVKMEVKQLKDSEVDEVSKLKTQLAQAEKKYESTNDEFKKKVEENAKLLHK